MASSGSSASPGRRSSGSQLLQELEALSQSLYKSQHVLQPRRTGSLSFTNARDSRSELVADVDEGMALPGLLYAGVHAFNMPGAMRHSIALPQAQSFDKCAKESGRPGLKARFSTSAAVREQSTEISLDQSVDIRSRKNNNSFSPWRSRVKAEENSSVEEDNDLSSWIEENIEFSRRLAESAEKKKGFWNWKPIRALSHIGMQRFTCLFSAHVAAIEGLPASMNGLRMAVHLRKKETKDGAVETMPVRVFQCMAEFEETLHIRCHVYGTKHGSHGFKFQPRPFTLSVVAVDARDLDFGKHHLDLSRLLLETVEKEASSEKWSNGWNISFALFGKARGAELAVGLGYEILDKGARDQIGNISTRFKDSFSRRHGGRSSQSLPNSARGSPRMTGYGAVSYESASPYQSIAGMNMMRMDHLDLNEPSREFSDRQGLASQDVYPARLPYRGVDNSVTNAFALIDHNPRPSPSLEEGNSANARRTESLPQESMPETSVAEGSSDYKAVVCWGENPGGADDDGCFEVVMQGVEIEKTSRDPNDDHNDESAGAVQKLEGKGHSVPLEDGGEIVKEVVQEAHQRRLSELQSIAQQISALENSIMHKKPSDEPLEVASTDLEKLYVKADESNTADQTAVDALEPTTDVLTKGDERVISNLDAEADLVAGEFLHMLEAEGGVKSSLFGTDSGILSDIPPLHLDELTSKRHTNDSLCQDTKDSGSNVGSQRPGSERELLASFLQAAETELERATQSLQSRSRAKLLEDTETEALMQEWGLNEEAFQSSPPRNTPVGSNYGNDVPMNHIRLPDLGDGLGPVVQTKDGGMLASMDPVHFQSVGRLVMQVSKPVVVPAEMGTNAVQILQKMAAMGLDDMAVQAMASMPLDDITGKTVEQIAFEGMATAINKNGYSASQQNELKAQGKGSMLSKGPVTVMASSRRSKGGAISGLRTTANIIDECVSPENLAPLAMQKIEEMAMEGLKIQAEMAEGETSYIVSPSPPQNIALESTPTGKQLSLLDDTKSNGLTTISLEEWMRLDAGMHDEEKTSEDTWTTFAAHIAQYEDITIADNQKINRTKRDYEERERNDSKGHGHMGNSLTIALLVQLRDPFRNYESVGSPMIALVQAERVVLPPRSAISKSVSMNDLPDDDEEENTQNPRFRIKGVHMSGLKMLGNEKKGAVWDGDKQNQTGSRWLLANGMAKNSRYSLLKSKVHTKPMHGDQQSGLWSISAQLNGGDQTIRNNTHTRLKPHHLRNPNVILPNQTIRTR